ncbi:MAG: type IX secretion system membrane protein PorP/SprF, partial [Chitinophagaceae bacterium]|nr:type IX secretion system membrane protein PorP/SprF [Chitinophagaceae bacterium]
VNPALTGIENYIDLKGSHRHQWVGIQDAPVTTYFTLHGPIGKSDYRTTATSYEMPGENPRGKRYWEEYTAAEPHHGIGMQIINDVTGPLSNFSVYATYAYHLGLTPRTSLSGGFGVGINRISLDADKLDFGDVTVDPVVFSTGLNRNTRLDVMAGLYLYSSDYFIGVSAQQIVPQKIDFSNNYIRPNEGKTVPHIFATAGYRFLVGNDFNFIPSVMVKYVQPLPTQVEVNGKLQYHDLAWIGASYRHKDGFAGMLGINVSNTFNVGYAYDYTTSELNNYSKGTHEIVVGFLIGNKYPDSCPRNVW